MKTATGRYRFRNEGELLVLQLEFSEYKQDPGFGVMAGSEVETWLDARTEDLLDVQFCKAYDIIPAPVRVKPMGPQ